MKNQDTHKIPDTHEKSVFSQKYSFKRPYELTRDAWNIIEMET